MTHVISAPMPWMESRSGAFRVKGIPAAKDNIIWLIACSRTGKAALVDGPLAKPALKVIEAEGLELEAILNTHTHPDHIGLNLALRKAGTLASLRVVGCRERASDIPGLTEPVDEGDEVSLGDARGRVMRTEGHIRGHISFVFENFVFCGDTMFGAGCGYLFDGPPEAMHESLQRLASLPPETKVCCAHEYTEDNLRFAYSIEPENAALRERIRTTRRLREKGESSVPSTIAVERSTNPFVRVDSEELLAQLRLQSESSLNSPAEIFAAARELKNTGAYREASLIGFDALISR